MCGSGKVQVINASQTVKTYTCTFIIVFLDYMNILCLNILICSVAYEMSCTVQLYSSVLTEHI